ncbi:hypothetical protein B5Z71_04750 [Campylobacter jejuni]|uniref:hypothetical protein n=2 Tax=Campylobacteraceae TaxID=72294 RepID=UPI000B4C17D4|nr:hypothetical protein [Campylobacter jejuni]OWK89913.1 hypothetical protein B5Z71_04750 [Campylobacter jejuni]RTJ09266.1 hypothetical protein C3H91_07350 [Campylobacter jejuni]RTJ50164.1 hypothetical protein C3H69_06905 [Campylobacter jejuni]
MEEMQKIQEEISNIRSDILKKYKYINEKYNLICEDNEGKISLYTQIEDIRNDIDYKLKDLDSQIDNFNKFYDETFGEFDKENNTRSGGLKQELQDLKENIEEFENEASDKLEIIQEKYNLICGEDNDESLYNQIENTKNDTEKRLQDLLNKIDNFNKFYDETFGEFDKENNTRSGGLKQELQDLKENIEEFENEASDKLEIIQEKYNLICGEDNDESLYNQIENTKNDTEKRLQDLSNKIDNFNKFYDETFGEFDKENNTRSGGLKKELQDLKQELQDYFKTQKEAFEKYEINQKNKFNDIEKDIKKLLGGATNGSLAHSYEISKNQYKSSIFFWNCAVFVSIISIIGLSGELIFSQLSKINANDYMSILSLAALRLPIYISLVWLGVFSTRRRNEIKRLQEEYKHKETVAKTYYGYQEQMEKLSDSGKAKELQERLMSNLVDMVNQNPNITLDKIKQENAPMIDFVEKFSKLPKDGQDMIKDMINKINIGAK